MTTALVSLTVFAVAALAVACLALLRAARLVETAYQQTVALNRAHDETMGKAVSSMVATAANLSTSLDERVAKRVGVVNSALRAAAQPNGPAPDPLAAVGEMPPPPMGTSGYLDDAHETMREVTRFTRDGAVPVRDAGIGIDLPPMPHIPTEAL